MRSDLHGKLKLLELQGPAGAGALALDIQPPAGREWIIYGIVFSHTDGANRNVYFAYNDGTDVVAFSQSTIASAGRAVLEPFETRNMRVSNAVWGEVNSSGWTDRDTGYARLIYADLGGH